MSFKITFIRISPQILDLLHFNTTDPGFLTRIGKRIRELRLRTEMIQNELAIYCNFEKASMSRIESGKTNVIILTLRRISRALNVENIEFFGN